jgi:chromosome segregation ATPase
MLNLTIPFYCLFQVESLQKVHKETEETAASYSTSRSELDAQLTRLQKANDDLQQQLSAEQRQCRDLEDKTLTLQRDAERLHRRLTRMEEVKISSVHFIPCSVVLRLAMTLLLSEKAVLDTLPTFFQVKNKHCSKVLQEILLKSVCNDFASVYDWSES